MYPQMPGYWTTQMVPARTNHLLHMVLTLFSLGFWSPVWAIVTLYNHNRSVPQQVWQPRPFVGLDYGYTTGISPVYPERIRPDSVGPQL